MTTVTRWRGRKGRATYSAQFLFHVREAVMAHRRKRGYGTRKLAWLMTDFDPSQPIADEAYDVLSHEALRDFCRKNRALPDSLIDLICEYMRAEDPTLTVSFDESDYREGIGEALMTFFGDPAFSLPSPDDDPHNFGTPGVYLSASPRGFLTTGRYSEDVEIVMRENTLLYVMVIREPAGHDFAEAAKIAIDNPKVTRSKNNIDFRPVPQVGYALPTANGPILIFRRQSDRLLVIENRENNAGPPHRTHAIVTAPFSDPYTNFEEFRHGPYAWYPLSENDPYFRDIAPLVVAELNGLSWRSVHG